MKTNSILIAVATALATVPVMANAQAGETEYEWSIETGLGYETNAYHAPDHNYADYYQDPTGATIVTPEEQGGVFIPLKVKAKMLNPLSNHTDLLAGYRFSGYYHPDAALRDANSTDHEVNLGASTRLGKKGNKGKAYAGVFVRSHDKVYVDRDSGDPKTSSAGVNVSNRYTYQSFGIEGDYERKLSRKNSVGVKAAYETLDYDDPVDWSEYDHTYTMLGAYWEHRLAKPTKFTLGVTSEVRDYKERHAYDADGSLRASNPLLTYTYMGYEAGLRHRFTDRTVAMLDLELLQRTDSHVGYNDMDETSVKLRLVHDLNEQIRVRAKVKYYDRDYANAFNFEDPAQGGKSASGTDLQLRGEYRYSNHQQYYLELEQNSRDNTDDRYQYDNTVMMMGVKWQY